MVCVSNFNFVVTWFANIYHCFCISRDGIKKDHERSELQPKKRQTSTEGSGYSLQNRPDSAPSSPHSKLSPRFSPCRPTTPPFPVTSQPLLITASQVQSSKAPSMTSPSEAASFSKQHSMHFAASASSQSMTKSDTNLQEKLKDATGRPAPISLLPSGGGQRKVQKTSFLWENTYLYSCWRLFVKINIGII